MKQRIPEDHTDAGPQRNARVKGTAPLWDIVMESANVHHFPTAQSMRLRTLKVPTGALHLASVQE